VIDIVGGVVYPVPLVTTLSEVTTPPAMFAVAVAPEPPPPVISTCGAFTYPEPPEI
jgi:hypothetical protein